MDKCLVEIENQSLPTGLISSLRTQQECVLKVTIILLSEVWLRGRLIVVRPNKNDGLINFKQFRYGVLTFGEHLHLEVLDRQAG